MALLFVGSSAAVKLSEPSEYVVFSYYYWRRRYHRCDAQNNDIAPQNSLVVVVEQHYTFQPKRCTHFLAISFAVRVCV